MNETHDERKVEMSEFMGLLFDDLDAEERIEGRWKLPGDDYPMLRDFFARADEFARKALELGPTHDVYVGVAPRRGNVGTREGVGRSRVVWKDLDFKDGHTPRSRAHQLRNLPCVPSMTVLSGGGCHAYWLLRGCLRTPEELNRAETLMARLAEGLGGDAVQDRSRILRVPGTFNHKTGTPRRVLLAYRDPDRRYALEQLEEMAAGLPRRNPTSGGFSGKVPKDVLGSPVRKGRRNVVLASVAGSLRDRGLDENTVRVVLLEVNRLRFEPPLPEREVTNVARSVCGYRPGSPRYLRSSARRVSVDGRAV